MPAYIPYGEGSASLGRLMAALNDYGSRAEGPEVADVDEAKAQVRQWQIDLRNSTLGPSELPQQYGRFAGTVDNQRISRILLDERRVLEGMATDFGSRSWYGNEN